MGKSVLSFFSLFAVLFILTECSNKPGGSGGGVSSSISSSIGSSSSYTSTIYAAGINDKGQACYWTNTSTTPVLLDTSMTSGSYTHSILV